MEDLTISHTAAEGTLIEGTAKGDGTAPVLKAHGWRWGRSIGSWFIPRSRDTAPKRHIIDATAAQLRADGFTVAVEVDASQRSTAEVEADKIARQADRAEALAAKAGRARGAAAAADHRADAAADRLPPGGEPIKIGHHSEARHRRDTQRAWDAMGASVQAHRDADEADRRAATAARTTAARYNPVTVANRIDKIEAEIRATDRRLNGYTAEAGSPYAHEVPPATGTYRGRLTAERAGQADALTYWQAVRAAQVETGQATNYGPTTVAKGDAVKIRDHWHRVARANKKTVSVETGYSWTDRAPWHEVQDHRAATT